MLRIDDLDYFRVIDENNNKIIHIEYDYDMADILEQVTKLVEYINNK